MRLRPCTIYWISPAYACPSIVVDCRAAILTWSPDMEGALPAHNAMQSCIWFGRALSHRNRITKSRVTPIPATRGRRDDVPQPDNSTDRAARVGKEERTKVSSTAHRLVRGLIDPTLSGTSRYTRELEDTCRKGGRIHLGHPYSEDLPSSTTTHGVST
ncbi:hypothetical protein L226DRAFT_226930 [Lentinus tigrinus ALCF2SS1-7]|uniref:uncharacterized protein n=1 Tax=Lentinus tigrinus ALCF2SS1-7 TaxID=1328758 RepID=UPI001165F776|nr:hypothetical protein L226DRAFT_226930 [Lentinus tigrinus ALCF2SS1-7]